MTHRRSPRVRKTIKGKQSLKKQKYDYLKTKSRNNSKKG